MAQEATLQSISRDMAQDTEVDDNVVARYWLYPYSPIRTGWLIRGSIKHRHRRPTDQMTDRLTDWPNDRMTDPLAIGELEVEIILKKTGNLQNRMLRPKL